MALEREKNGQTGCPEQSDTSFVAEHSGKNNVFPFFDFRRANWCGGAIGHGRVSFIKILGS